MPSRRLHPSASSPTTTKVYHCNDQEQNQDACRRLLVCCVGHVLRRRSAHRSHRTRQYHIRVPQASREWGCCRAWPGASHDCITLTCLESPCCDCSLQYCSHTLGIHIIAEGNVQPFVGGVHQPCQNHTFLCPSASWMRSFDTWWDEPHRTRPCLGFAHKSIAHVSRVFLALMWVRVLTLLLVSVIGAIGSGCRPRRHLSLPRGLWGERSLPLPRPRETSKVVLNVNPLHH